MKRTIIGLTILWQICRAGDWQSLYQAYQQAANPALRDSLRQLIKANPQVPELIYLAGLMEDNGEKAVLLYRDVLTKFPKSSVADNALLKIIEYLYIKGLYVKTTKYALDLMRAYPNSECISEAGYFLLASYAAMNKVDSLAYYQQYLATKYPGVKFDYALSERATSVSPPVQASVPVAAPLQPPKVLDEKPAGDYTLQVGVFSVPQNAAALRSRLTKAGYAARIETTVVQGRRLTAVRVGYFATRAEAQAFGVKMKHEQNVDFLVIKR